MHNTGISLLNILGYHFVTIIPKRTVSKQRMHLATYCYSTCTTIVTHFSTEARGMLPSDPPTAYRQSDMTATPTPNRLLAIAGTRDHWLVAGLYLQG